MQCRTGAPRPLTPTPERALVLALHCHTDAPRSLALVYIVANAATCAPALSTVPLSPLHSHRCLTVPLAVTCDATAPLCCLLRSSPPTPHQCIATPHTATYDAKRHSHCYLPPTPLPTTAAPARSPPPQSQLWPHVCHYTPSDRVPAHPSARPARARAPHAHAPTRPRAHAPTRPRAHAPTRPRALGLPSTHFSPLRQQTYTRLCCPCLS